jgi:hypothetical protein
MSDSQPYSPGPSLLPIERPRCSKCSTRMKLSRIMPGPAGYVFRNFECNRCVHVMTVTVATDPMKSDTLGWLAGELKPPE